MKHRCPSLSSIGAYPAYLMGKVSGQAQLSTLRTDDYVLRASYTFSHPSPLYLEYVGRTSLVGQ
jgi:hypothetical protein